MSNAVLGFGTKLNRGTSAAGPFTSMAQSVDVKSPEPEVAKVKVTNNDSPNNSQEYIPGLFDPGDLELEVIYTPTVQAQWYADFAARSVQWYTVVFPDGSGWKFPGFVQKFGDETKTENEAIKAKVTVKPTYSAVPAAWVTVAA